MAAGDVEVQIVSASTVAVDTALTSMRSTAGANGHYGAVSIGPENQQILLWAIEET